MRSSFLIKALICASCVCITFVAIPAQEKNLPGARSAGKRVASEAQSNSYDPCIPTEMEAVPGGAKIWSPDKSKYLINDKDRNGNDQIYVGTAGSDEPVCISCRKMAGAPLPNRDKMQAKWHPSGRWIILAGEKVNHIGRLLPRTLRQGLMECGVWMDIYATTADGASWYKLQSTDSFTGVSFTPDGSRGVWAQGVGPVSKSAPFGLWRLKLADFVERDGAPHLENVRDITPPGGKWFEPGNFSSNGHDLLITADVGLSNAFGQDQFILDIKTGHLTNLTNSPAVWDEHGLFSPDCAKIVFMSSYPYRKEPNSYKLPGLKTEFMVMNSDGSHLRQLTHFQVPGYPEYARSGSTAAVAWFNDEKCTELTGTQLLSGKRFPNYQVWKITLKEPGGTERQEQ